jgi:hypothetical protein
MTSLSRRQKLVGGAFAIVACSWLVDMLTGGQTPASANAASSESLQANLAPEQLDPTLVQAVIASLASTDDRRPPLPFHEAKRDLFVPSTRMLTALGMTTPETTATSEGDQNVDQQPFETRHQLAGVLTGRVPLALIDGRLYRRGAEIDGYRLVELRDDYVVLQQGNSRVVLRVRQSGDPATEPTPAEATTAE